MKIFYQSSAWANVPNSSLETFSQFKLCSDFSHYEHCSIAANSTPTSPQRKSCSQMNKHSDNLMFFSNSKIIWKMCGRELYAGMSESCGVYRPSSSGSSAGPGLPQSFVSCFLTGCGYGCLTQNLIFRQMCSSSQALKQELCVFFTLKVTHIKLF